MSNLFVIIITYATQSLESKAMLRLQTFGELSIMITADFFLIFRVVSVETNFELGYATIGAIGSYMFLCACYIIWNLVIDSKWKFRRWLAYRRYFKQRRNLSDILKKTRT